jgi:hypothetical protein
MSNEIHPQFLSELHPIIPKAAYVVWESIKIPMPESNTAFWKQEVLELGKLN